MDKSLYLVSTPIGNIEDITLRALNILKSCDFIICEEYKEARRFLSNYQITKELISINEHNEKENTATIIQQIKDGKKAALISDCGTPLFSDPGHYLVDQCIKSGIEIVPIPGASSLLPALVASNFNIEKFYYYGWLSPKKEIRNKELFRLKNRKDLIIFLETPYRLKTILADCFKAFGANKNAVLAYEITNVNEKFYRGTVSEIKIIAENLNLKGEFVLLIDNR